ncbi:TetR/AcrR family transcriptional regulator [Dongia rigui]|uniref:Helix-turn-helix domain-containing protein n=1 Tax=Dongia rigui TaxID=940149 RepID=A0ABU5DY71_9PROT|nr:helix-turn-helix domain-containing protein [Dongia rigui]MDY0872173.1 helix-turn-helix domain-containing protein [Dongia rigui]
MARREPEKRPYQQKRRAELTAETRRRIVEAAIELHTDIGPGRTTISMVAERAGVQRHTFYAHFPDERSLLMACSGEAMARDPLPDAGPWRELARPKARLKTGLKALYDWYGRNADLTACVLRDAEYHELVRDISALRWGPGMARIIEVLGEGLEPRQIPLLHLALSFHSWRSLVRESGLETEAAVDAMVAAIFAKA